MKHSDKLLHKETTRKLQLLPGIEPQPQRWESTTLTTVPIPHVFETFDNYYSRVFVYIIRAAIILHKYLSNAHCNAAVQIKKSHKH